MITSGINQTAVVSRHIPDDPKPFRFIDGLVILILLLLALWFVRLFYLNLFQTLDSNSEQIGFVTMRINNIQRRQGDRVLWDRIRNESPVYNSDLIRVAEQSGVAFHFDNNSVELDENTMIRVFRSADGHTRIELAAGTLKLDTGENGGNISLVAGGKIIEAQAGSVLSVESSGEEVVLNVLSVTEGYAVLIDEEGNPYDAEAGAVISFSGSSIEVDTTNVVTEKSEEELAVSVIETEITEPVFALLPAPLLIQPESNYHLGPSQLRTIRELNFNWQSVTEANTFVLTLYQQTASGMRMVVPTGFLTQTSWTLGDLSILNSGRYIWQVEAIYRDSTGAILRRGNLAESYFTVDIPVPAVQLHETRNLYDQ